MAILDISDYILMQTINWRHIILSFIKFQYKYTLIDFSKVKCYSISAGVLFLI